MGPLVFYRRPAGRPGEEEPQRGLARRRRRFCSLDGQPREGFAAGLCEKDTPRDPRFNYWPDLTGQPSGFSIFLLPLGIYSSRVDDAWRAARWPRHGVGDRWASVFDVGDILGIILISRWLLAGLPSMLEIERPLQRPRKPVDGS